jgi:hypothetical protein
MLFLFPCPKTRFRLPDGYQGWPHSCADASYTKAGFRAPGAETGCMFAALLLCRSSAFRRIGALVGIR